MLHMRHEGTATNICFSLAWLLRDTVSQIAGRAIASSSHSNILSSYLGQICFEKSMNDEAQTWIFACTYLSIRAWLPWALSASYVVTSKGSATTDLFHFTRLKSDMSCVLLLIKVPCPISPIGNKEKQFIYDREWSISHVYRANT